jgi:hypothetical protein
VIEAILVFLSSLKVYWGLDRFSTFRLVHKLDFILFLQ